MHSSKLLTKYKSIYTSKFSSFIAGVVDTADPRIFEKIRNGPNGTLRGPGDTNLYKKLEAQISCQSPFNSDCTLPLRKIGAIPEGWRADGEDPGLEGERAAKPLIGLPALHHVAELSKVEY